jgi:cell division protein ZapA (FtsZ GTPase activity inhibitor)
MSDLLTININIADRTYRVKVEKQEEETVRATCKLINDKIVEFKTSFAGKDMQDYLAMAFLWYATNGPSYQNNVDSEAIQNANEKLKQLIQSFQ